MRATTATHIQTRRQQKAARKNSHLCNSNENQRQTSRKTAATKSPDDYQLVARATKHAIRDWDLSSGALTWPQGLDSLFGYSPGASRQTIAFWQHQIHRDDRSRIAASIREAIKSKAEHWSGEYRFRHAKGHYLQLLERALLVRDKNGRAVRLVGALMVVTALKQVRDELAHAQH